MTQSIVLGVFLQGFGHHQAAWHHPANDLESEFSLQHYVKLTRIAERGILDFVFLADVMGWRDYEMETMQHMPRAAVFEPVTLLTALAMSTDKIGLIATASTSYYEPYVVARLFGSLDVSQRRKSRLEPGYINHGIRSPELQPQPTDGAWRALCPCRRVRRRGSGALGQLGQRTRFRAIGQPVCSSTSNRVKRLNFEGKHFSVRGPLNVPRSPQGRPVVVQAGSSEAGKTLASKTADLIFTRSSLPSKMPGFSMPM